MVERQRWLALALGRVLALKGAIAALVVGLFWWKGSEGAGRSALYGAAAALLPALFMALRMVRVGDRGAREIVRALWTGEVVKFLLAAAIFAVAFRQQETEPLPLFLAFAAVVLGDWIALLLERDQR